jgi:hypothetical protein
VSANDRVHVPRQGLRAAFELLLNDIGHFDVIAELRWPANLIAPSAMSAGQLSVLLLTIHDHRDLYTIDGNSCYWYAFTVMEVIRLKFGAQETRGPAFKDRSKALTKMNVGTAADIEEVGLLYDTNWADCMEKARKREDAVRANEENIRTRIDTEQKLAQETARRERAEKERERAEKERERAEKEQELAAKKQERAEKERERAEKERERAEKEQELAAKKQEWAEKERERAEADRDRERKRAEALATELEALRKMHK